MNWLKWRWQDGSILTRHWDLRGCELVIAGCCLRERHHAALLQYSRVLNDSASQALQCVSQRFHHPEVLRSAEEACEEELLGVLETVLFEVLGSSASTHIVQEFVKALRASRPISTMEAFCC